MLSMRALWRFRASTTLPPGPEGPSGAPEVSLGNPSPPLSPPLTSIGAAPVRSVASKPRGGAACTIAGECERLFDETLKAVFRGELPNAEWNAVGQVSLSRNMDMQLHHHHHHHHQNTRDSERRNGSATGLPSPQLDGLGNNHGLLRLWIEVWDYVGGARFRGFVAEKDGERTMFAFFDQGVIGNDLKPGLMALLELCGAPPINCSRLTACLDRTIEPKKLRSLTRDLGWVGFEPTTLAGWTGSDGILSDFWLFLDMET